MSAQYSQVVDDSGNDWDADSPSVTLTLSGNANRKLIIYVFREKDDPQRSVASIDVQGNAATFIVKADTLGGGFREDTDSWYYDVGAGESGSITITPVLDGASNNDWAIAVIELYDAATGIPTLFDTDAVSSSPVSFSLIDCPTGSIVVYGSVANGGVSGSGGFFVSPASYTEVVDAEAPGSATVGLKYTAGYKSISTVSAESFSVAAAADTGQNQTGVAVCVEEWVGGGVAYTLSADSGEYNTSGSAAGILALRKLVAEAGGYVTTGYDAVLTYNESGGPDYTLSADSGSYVTTGYDAGFLVGRTISLDSGSYSMSGQDAGLYRNYTLEVESGSYTTTGYDVSFGRDYVLNAETGSYTTRGYSANLLLNGESPTTKPRGAAGFHGKGTLFYDTPFIKELEEERKERHSEPEIEKRKLPISIKKAAVKAEKKVAKRKTYQAIKFDVPNMSDMKTPHKETSIQHIRDADDEMALIALGII
jgi:hypothetical protein